MLLLMEVCFGLLVGNFGIMGQSLNTEHFSIKFIQKVLLSWTLIFAHM